MKISYDEINNRNDPYQLFLDGIKSPETARKYTKSLKKFLRSISDEERLRFENEQKQAEIEEIEKKNLELQDLSQRIDELEYGPEARGSDYFKHMFKARDYPSTEILLTIFQLWFEMRATEDEKRILWKKIQDAKRNGKILDISEFGESQGLSWKNLSSK